MNTISPQPDAAVFPLGRAVLWLVGIVAVLAGVVYGVCVALGSPTGAMLNLMAAGFCGLAGVAGLLPVWFMSKSSPHGGAMGFLTGILFRMAVAGGAVLYLQWATDWPHAQDFSIWIASWYLVVLMIEVKLVSSHVLTVAPGPSRAGGSFQPEPQPPAETP